jgi:DNA-binding LytR/AlgR family response regulator
MNNFNCLVLEDTLSDQLAIEMVLSQFDQLHVTYVDTPKGFLLELSKNTFQIYVIDIMLNDALTGIDLMHAITDPTSWVIISSSLESRDYYEQYKDLKFNKFYIKKPIDEFVFKTNIESFLFSRNEKIPAESNENYLMVKQGNYINKVKYSEIVFIQTSDHATSIHTVNNKYTTYSSLNSFQDLLKESGFEKVNRNTLVNMATVTRINIKESYMEVDKNQILISRNNKQLLKEKYLDKMV